MDRWKRAPIASIPAVQHAMGLKRSEFQAELRIRIRNRFLTDGLAPYSAPGVPSEKFVTFDQATNFLPWIKLPISYLGSSYRFITLDTATDFLPWIQLPISSKERIRI